MNHPVAFTQSYDPVQDHYSETFSFAWMRIDGRVSAIENFLNQAFYFRTLNALDTPVSLAIFWTPDGIEHRLKGLANAGFSLLVDPGTGAFQSYTGLADDELLRVKPSELNLYRPHRFALYDVPASDYDTASAQAILTAQSGVFASYLIQGTTYSDPRALLVGSRANSGFIAVLTYIAGLKKTEIACASRVSFSLRIEGAAAISGEQAGAQYSEPDPLEKILAGG